jgi:hypothetical protein
METATNSVSAQTALARNCVAVGVVDSIELCLSLTGIGIQAESS